jgi:hypothetical protein
LQKDNIGYSHDAGALRGSAYNRGTGCGKTARPGPWFKLKSFVLNIDTKTKKGIRVMALESFPVSRNRKDSLVDLQSLEPCWLTHEWMAV